ncbi:MAG: GNAT family N-acetyltransferase, partial [Mesorhizobium sp.]
MTLSSWHEEPIAKRHDRASFDCGDAQMNDFLRRYARQSHEQNAAKTFCAIDDAALEQILGFYT